LAWQSVLASCSLLWTGDSPTVGKASKPQRSPEPIEPGAPSVERQLLRVSLRLHLSREKKRQA
jgi:hypothetical protein